MIRFFREHDPFYLELASGLIMLGWIFLLVLMPEDRLTRTSVNDFYDIVTLHHRGYIEAGGFLFGAGQSLIAVLKWARIGRMHPGAVLVFRLLCAFGQCWGWFFLTFGLYVAVRHLIQPGYALYGGMAAANGALVFIHMQRTAGVLLEKHLLRRAAGDQQRAC